MATILIVEDEQFIRQTAEFTIEDLGHTILVASDVDEAISRLATPGPIDALFVDMRLISRVFGGCEVADHAILQRPDMRVLYTSGKPLTEEMSGMFVAGWQFLQKPYSPFELEASVGALLQ